MFIRWLLYSRLTLDPEYKKMSKIWPFSYRRKEHLRINQCYAWGVSGGGRFWGLHKGGRGYGHDRWKGKEKKKEKGQIDLAVRQFPSRTNHTFQCLHGQVLLWNLFQVLSSLAQLKCGWLWLNTKYLEDCFYIDSKFISLFTDFP